MKQICLRRQSVYFKHVIKLGPVCLLESRFFKKKMNSKKMNSMKVNSGKVNYFPMFGTVMKNKLENTFQCLIMSWKMSWKITY